MHTPTFSRDVLYGLVWADAYAAAWHHEYLRRLETTDRLDKHAAALLHGRERECMEIADKAVDDLRRADAMSAEQTPAR